eukprot:7385399-Prymnesium_polylepis.1
MVRRGFNPTGRARMRAQRLHKRHTKTVPAPQGHAGTTQCAPSQHMTKRESAPSPTIMRTW